MWRAATSAGDDLFFPPVCLPLTLLICKQKAIVTLLWTRELEQERLIGKKYVLLKVINESPKAGDPREHCPLRAGPPEAFSTIHYDRLADRIRR